MNVSRGSGTFVGIDTLISSVKAIGCDVDLISPRLHFPVYTIERLVFNESLRFIRNRNEVSATVGFDLDGYALAQKKHRIPHIASIKGVIADEMRHERGLTRATMMVQAHYEARHVRNADFVITTSQYAASRLKDLYSIPKVHAVIPELIDLTQWHDASRRYGRPPDRSKFVVLCVCRFYPRKRITLLLGAADLLRDRIPNLQVRIVGGGPESNKLHAICRAKQLHNVVIREDISHSELIQEYTACDVFCLPSVQEGFGIVFLEAMACRKPIIAARASAVPEVVQHGILVEPDSISEIANAIQQLHSNPSLREDLGNAGAQFVRQFDAPHVAGMFVDEVSRILERA
jgi:glycosyltransferase involved in cell wall biosynthesis